MQHTNQFTRLCSSRLHGTTGYGDSKHVDWPHINIHIAFPDGSIIVSHMYLDYSSPPNLIDCTLSPKVNDRVTAEYLRLGYKRASDGQMTQGGDC
jgi:hypothetical protein